MNLFIKIIVDYVYYVFIAQLLFVMFMGLKKADSGKRYAAMFQSFPFFAVFITARFIFDKQWNPYFIFVPIGLSIIFLILLRGKVFPYNRYCPDCGKQRNWGIILFSDEKQCLDCYQSKAHQDTEE